MAKLAKVVGASKQGSSFFSPLIGQYAGKKMLVKLKKDHQLPPEMKLMSTQNVNVSQPQAINDPIQDKEP